MEFHYLSLTQYIWYSALNYFSNPWALIILLYLVYRLKFKSKSSTTIVEWCHIFKITDWFER